MQADTRNVKKYVSTSSHGGMVAVVSNNYAGTYVRYEDYADLLAIAEAAEDLRAACAGLLSFIRERYPEDFVEGGRGYICPHHRAIETALSTVAPVRASGESNEL